jgi:hypothetical protein
MKILDLNTKLTSLISMYAFNLSYTGSDLVLVNFSLQHDLGFRFLSKTFWRIEHMVIIS